jgi:RNA polymerase sigma factor (sigma-70 family)
MQVSRIEVLLAFRRGTYRGDGLAFESFYRRIAENNVRDAIRRIKCRRGLLRDLEAGDSEADSDGERVTRFLTRLTRVGTTPSRGMHESERRALLDREIAKLPADYARVLRLFFFEDRSPGEIASEMGRSYGAVAMLKSRALEWLAGQLGSGTAVF